MKLIDVAIWPKSHDFNLGYQKQQNRLKIVSNHVYTWHFLNTLNDYPHPPHNSLPHVIYTLNKSNGNEYKSEI